MPVVMNDGVRISYDVIGQGRPIVLLHGWLGERFWWAETGYLDDLGRDHLIINVDLRGHGDSDAPHEPSMYRGERLTSDVLAVADAEGLDRFALWGLSYGGWIAWMTANSAPGRIPALITTGAWNPLPDTDESWHAFDAAVLEPLRQGGLAAVVALFEDERFRFSPELKASLLRRDPLAMLACQSSELIGMGVPTIEGFPVPALIIAGDLEDEDGGAVRAAQAVVHGESLILPGLGHAAACAASALTIPTARAFLDTWFG